MKITFLLLAIALIPVVVQAQTKKISDTELIVENFFKMYNEVGRTEAILKLLASNKWIAKEDADTVALQLEGIVVQVGPYFGNEKISERTYGKSVVQYT